MFTIKGLSFKRCIRPHDAAGDPILVVFCDSSELAFGACAYVLWKLNDGSQSCKLLMAKTHIALINTISIVKLELNGAKLGPQLKSFIYEESQMKFSKCYMVVDSQIVHAIIQKDSYRFNTYCGLRINEIQERTDTKDWYWVKGEDNVADCLSRGSSPKDLHENSKWQNGPAFMEKNEEEWPIEQAQNILEIPHMIKTIMQLQISDVDSLQRRINISKYSSFVKLIRVTCRIYQCINTLQTCRLEML